MSEAQFQAEVMDQLYQQEISMKEIYGALAKAQKNFEAARKTANNPHFKSKYAGLDACMDAVRDACNDQGIFVTQTIESVEAGVLIETVFAHSSGAVYAGGKLFMPAQKHDAQGYGSAITYGRRYSLLAACGVAPEDDDGNAASEKKIVHAPTGTPLVAPERMSIIADVADAVKQHFASEDIVGAYKEASGLQDPEERTQLWKMLDSKIRSALKKHADSLREGAGMTRA